MNIVLYTHSFLPVLGGRELVVHHLARALTDLGHQVRVVGPHGWRRHRKLRHGYPVHRWPSLKGLLVEQVRLVELFLDVSLWGCDVIHAHGTYPSGYIAGRLKSIRPLPLVITPHGDDIHVAPHLERGLRLNPALNTKISYALARADIVTAISASIEDSLREAGAAPEKIRRIPNGVDMERFQEKVTLSVRERFSIPRNSRIILAVGNYRPLKGFEVLIRAMPLILAQEPRVHLTIVGKHRGALDALIRELRLSEKVTLTGTLPLPVTAPVSSGLRQPANGAEDFLAALYQSSELYVSASIDQKAEGLSLALLEAMAAGLPVVATDISGNQDVVRNSENGFLVPPEDPTHLAEAILQLLSDPKLRDRLTRNTAQTAQTFHWKQIARRYLATYAQTGRCHDITA